MKLLITILFILLSAASVAAQQDPLYSQYLLNPLVINPAYAGLNNNMHAMVGYRTQWTGFEGHPETLTASIHSSIVNNKAGAGLMIVQDKLGNATTTEFNASFAYKLNLGQTTFSFGMQAGLQNFKSDNSGINLYNPSDPAFTANERISRVNIGAGAILKGENFMLGLSVPRLLPTTFSNGGQNFQLYSQHLYLFGAYVFTMNEHIRFKPAAMLRAVGGAPASIDVAFNFNINTVHTAGVFTRNFNTYGVLLQTMLQDKFRLGYVFEMPTNQSVGSQFTSHEITLGVKLSAFGFQDNSVSNF
ncbi:type IX secretion system membrane protein PorP/SprF [soil metagenome]